MALRLAVTTAKLPKEDHKFAQRLRRGKYRPWWNAYRRGVAQVLRDEYMTRWLAATGKTERDWTYNPAMKLREDVENNWDKAANNIIDLGCEVPFFMDVAEDTKPRNMKFPPLQIISSPKFKMTVLNWAEKSERSAELMVDGMTWDELVKRSEEMDA